jgi:hypothetical protein
LIANLVQRHKTCWKSEGLQVFWTGDSFDGALEELSYHLAEVFARNILAAHRGSFIEFLSRAEWRDAGDAAAREVLGCNLGEIAAQFLGPGNWSPQPIEQDPATRFARPTDSSVTLRTS